MKLPGHHESDVQLPKMQYPHATAAISTAATTTTNTTLTMQLILLPPKYCDTSTIKAKSMKVKFERILMANLNKQKTLCAFRLSK